MAVTGDHREGEVIDLELPPRPAVVAMARLIVGALAAWDPSFDEERNADIRLAVSEACTNAIAAQRRGSEPDAPVRLRCRLGDGQIEVSVTDRGRGFDPSAIDPHPEVTDPARLEHESGLGIPLLRLLADQLEFRATSEGTTVVMVFGPEAATGRLDP